MLTEYEINLFFLHINITNDNVIFSWVQLKLWKYKERETENDIEGGKDREGLHIKF